jgi:ribonucleoside-diphosphate reductase alpha chain
MVAGCSSGIEPRFAPAWNKDVLEENGIDFVDNDLVADVRESTGMTEREAVAAVSRFGTAALADDGRRARYRYAYDVSGLWHVRVAARWQQWTDNAVSKTVNMPKDATPQEVGEVMRASWDAGSKGVSIYRQGSREHDLLSTVQQAESNLAQSKALLAATGTMA